MRRDGQATNEENALSARVARRRAARSHETLARFRARLAVAVLAAALAHAAGGQALPVAAAFCIGGAVVSSLRAFATREPFMPPYLGLADEAAWFLLLGHGVRALHGA